MLMNKTNDMHELVNNSCVIQALILLRYEYYQKRGFHYNNNTRQWNLLSSLQDFVYIFHWHLKNLPPTRAKSA